MHDWQPISDALKQQIPEHYRQWVTESYILTQHLKHTAAGATRIQVLSQNWHAETWQRKIVHCIGDQPVVFAQVDVPKDTYQALEKQLGNLGDQPLGETLLYNSDSVTRSAFEVRQLEPADTLYQEVSAQLSQHSEQLWARRSTFYWKGLPLTITEVFLPGLPSFTDLTAAQTRGFCLKQKCWDYIHLIRLHRPTPILLMLWPTLWGLWIAAGGFPGWKLLLIFVVGTFVMRSAGDIFNDMADRKFDGHVDRTHTRPMATGRVKAKAAVIFVIVLVLVALLLVLQTNWVTVGFSVIGLGLAMLYPLMKRITYWPQAVLGLAYNWGIILAFTAVLNTSPPLFAWWLWLSAVFWTIAYDSMYALSDVQDDQRLGLKSTAVIFGEYYHLWIGGFQLLTLTNWVLVGWYLGLPWFYYIAVAVSALLFAHQHTLLVQKSAPSNTKAFNNNHWVGLFMFLSIFFHFNC